MYSRFTPLYFRFTPSLATAIFSTSVFVLWCTVDAAIHDFTSNVFSNAVTMSTVASWLYVASGRRRDLARQQDMEGRVAEATIHEFKSQQR